MNIIDATTIMFIPTFHYTVPSIHDCPLESDIDAFHLLASQRTLLPIHHPVNNTVSFNQWLYPIIAYQLEGFLDLVLGESMVDNVEEANGFASIKHLSGHFLWVALKVGKVNDGNVAHHDEYLED